MFWYNGHDSSMYPGFPPSKQEKTAQQILDDIAYAQKAAAKYCRANLVTRLTDEIANSQEAYFGEPCTEYLDWLIVRDSFNGGYTAIRNGFMFTGNMGEVVEFILNNDHKTK